MHLYIQFHWLPSASSANLFMGYAFSFREIILSIIFHLMKRTHEKKFRKRMNVFSLVPLFLSLHSLLIIGTTAFNLQDGRGPSKSGERHPEWSLCAVGKLQSPVDFNDRYPHLRSLPQLGDLRRNYRQANATIFSKGRYVEVEWKGDAGNLNINGTNYDLKAVHWHTPAEHTFNGKRYDMEIHMVHQNAKGNRAVVGIVYEIGRPDPFLSELLPSIKSVTKEEKDIGRLNPEGIGFQGRQYYRYMGSLTTPPCTEDIVWTVLKTVVTVSGEQVQALKDVVDPGFRQNARRIQELHGRPVYVYSPPEIGNLD